MTFANMDLEIRLLDCEVSFPFLLISPSLHSYYSNDVMRRCNALVRIIRHLSKSFIMSRSSHMRYEHFPLFTHGINRAIQNALIQASGFLYGGVSAASGYYWVYVCEGCSKFVRGSCIPCTRWE